MWICINNLDQIIWLAENRKWAWILIYSAWQGLREMELLSGRLFCQKIYWVASDQWSTLKEKNLLLLETNSFLSEETWCAGKQTGSHKCHLPCEIVRMCQIYIAPDKDMQNIILINVFYTKYLEYLDSLTAYYSCPKNWTSLGHFRYIYIYIYILYDIL